MYRWEDEFHTDDYCGGDDYDCAADDPNYGIMTAQMTFQVNSDFPESKKKETEAEEVIIDDNKGWIRTLTKLPELAKGSFVKFNVVEREFGTRFQSSSFVGVDEPTIAYDVSDSDTLLGILFDESLKSKCIANIDVQKWSRPFLKQAVELDITIVLVQGTDNHSNIDSKVLDCFSRILER